MKGLKKFFKIIFEIISDIVKGTIYFVSNNLRKFAWFLNLILPYAMYIIGQYVCKQKGYIGIGLELLIPVVTCVVIYFIRSFANKIGKGTSIPVPYKRFTTVDDDGEVSIKPDQIQEVLLYLADLEDWLERKGFI